MSFDDHFAASDARPGAEVDQIVGRAHGVFVVFDHDDGISDVAQMLQRVDQPIVIAWMKSDRGFVQDI